jgi:hypothetical protein
MKSKIEITQVQVHARINGNRLRFIDLNGKAISRWLNKSDVSGVLNETVEESPNWEQSVKRMVWRFESRTALRKGSPWQAKASTLAASFRIRGQMLDWRREPTGRRHFEQYGTKTWEAATKRLWTQGHNRFRRYARTGWARWAATVSNNHNKKKGGKYARKYNSHSQKDHEHDRAAELSLCG